MEELLLPTLLSQPRCMFVFRFSSLPSCANPTNGETRWCNHIENARERRATDKDGRFQCCYTANRAYTHLPEQNRRPVCVASHDLREVADSERPRTRCGPQNEIIEPFRCHILSRQLIGNKVPLFGAKAKDCVQAIPFHFIHQSVKGEPELRWLMQPLDLAIAVK